MNKRLILIIGGILLVGTLLVGAIWGWLIALTYLIGVLLVTLIVLGRYALLNPKTYSLGTILYSNPTTWLYSVLFPHSRNQSHDLDDPSEKTQGPDESEEQRERNTEGHKN